jgi:hypothetical protein
LEKKLSEARQQLAEIKSTWSDKISQLEAQVLTQPVACAVINYKLKLRLDTFGDLYSAQPFWVAQALRAECVTPVTQQTGNHNEGSRTRILLPLAVNSKSE